MQLTFRTRGSFNRMERYLKRVGRWSPRSILEKHAQAGVNALRAATPSNTGLAANSWGYIITRNRGAWTITWTNGDIENGFPVAVSIQYGYSTGTGGYVSGRDYINPALRPIFDRLAEEGWRELTRV
jgi:hypothetical protein